LKLLKNRFWDIKEKKKLEILQKKEDFGNRFQIFSNFSVDIFEFLMNI